MALQERSTPVTRQSSMCLFCLCNAVRQLCCKVPPHSGSRFAVKLAREGKSPSGAESVAKLAVVVFLVGKLSPMSLWSRRARWSQRLMAARGAYIRWSSGGVF